MLSKPDSGWTDLDKREIELNKKLDRLKKLIDKQRKYFLDNCCFL